MPELRLPGYWSNSSLDKQMILRSFVLFSDSPVRACLISCRMLVSVQATSHARL